MRLTRKMMGLAGRWGTGCNRCRQCRRLEVPRKVVRTWERRSWRQDWDLSTRVR